MTVTVVPYTPHYETIVRDLVTQNARVHYHLDWHSLDTWLHIAREPSILVYNANHQLTGVILFAPPTDGYVWVRMVALRRDTSPEFTVTLLHQSILQAKQWGLEHIMMLETIPWLKSAMQQVGFHLIDHIVHFWRNARPLEARHSKQQHVQVRLATEADVAAVLHADHDAFAPPWQLREYDIHAMLPKALLLTVAVSNETVVGYQLSTQYYDKVHLTRLAVVPSMQRRGVASALIRHLIEQHPAREITVNTQQSNFGSRRFYEGFGFRRLNYRTPIWHRKIAPP
jgi:[ribosomal protein S18]-alanine N-acetyltransferase